MDSLQIHTVPRGARVLYQDKIVYTNYNDDHDALSCALFCDSQPPTNIRSIQSALRGKFVSKQGGLIQAFTRCYPLTCCATPLCNQAWFNMTSCDKMSVEDLDRDYGLLLLYCATLDETALYTAVQAGRIVIGRSALAPLVALASVEKTIYPDMHFGRVKRQTVNNVLQSVIATIPYNHQLLCLSSPSITDMDRLFVDATQDSLVQ